MKVWLVTGGEPLPVGGGASQRLYRTGQLALYLASSDHDVTWWTPNFDHSGKRPFFPAEGGLEYAPNFRLRLLVSPGYRRNISLRRAYDHAVVGHAFAQAAKGAVGPDVIVASLPTIDLAAQAVRFANRRRIPVVVDLRDMWPEIYVWQVPRPLQSLARLAMSPLFRRRDECLAQASALWAISDDFLDWGLRCAGRKRRVCDGAFYMVDDSSAPEERCLREARQYWNAALGPSEEGGIIGCFAGSINHQFDLETVVSATSALRHEGVKIRVVIAGDGETRSRLVRRYGEGSGAIWPGWIDRAQLLTLMERSDFGLDPMPARDDFEATINNKALDYLKAAIGVVSCPDRGALARLLRERSCGASYPARDPEALKGILRGLSADRKIAAGWSLAARAFAKSELDPKQIYGRMTSCLAAIVASVQAEP